MSEQNNKQNPESKKTEDDVKIYEEAVSIDRSRQKSRKIFVFYIVGLFCVALALILLSYVMQAHANQQLEDLGAQLTEQTDAAAGAKARADQMQAIIDAMQEQVDEYQQQTDEQNRTIDALNQLWQLERAWQEGDNTTALDLIEQMDQAYTREVLTDEAQEPLTGEAAREYADICEDLGV